jgi:hypothetical protein
VARITGRERVVARLSGAAGEKTIREVGKALFAGAEMIRAEAAHLITQNATSGKHHVPSLPHQPPNEDTGTLRIHLEATQPAPLRAEASSNAPHAVPLEGGTSDMIERPYMGPATKRRRKEIVAGVVEAVNRATKAS